MEANEGTPSGALLLTGDDGDGPAVVEPTTVLPESIEKAIEAGDGKVALDAAQIQDALSWLLSDDEDDLTGLRQELRLNVGTEDAPQYVRWVVQAVDWETIARARRRASGENRRAKRAGTPVGEFDEMRAALDVVAAGTVEPNLQQAAATKQVFDQTLILKHRFQRKPGLILQINNVILDLSGWNEEGVELAQAAKNS